MKSMRAENRYDVIGRVGLIAAFADFGMESHNAVHFNSYTVGLRTTIIAHVSKNGQHPMKEL